MSDVARYRLRVPGLIVLIWKSGTGKEASEEPQATGPWLEPTARQLIQTGAAPFQYLGEPKKGRSINKREMRRRLSSVLRSCFVVVRGGSRC